MIKKISKFYSSIRRYLGLLSIAILTLTVVSSCAINPATGRGNLVLMGEHGEKEIQVLER